MIWGFETQDLPEVEGGGKGMARTSSLYDMIFDLDVTSG